MPSTWLAWFVQFQRRNCTRPAFIAWLAYFARCEVSLPGLGPDVAANRSARRILAIDPGSERSAWLVWSGTVEAFGIADNTDLLADLYRREYGLLAAVVIEKIESYGMPVGAEVFATVHWSGRFTEAARPVPVTQLPRRAVKLAICGDTRAKDANIRQALLDRFGPDAVGRKGAPGPLYGISKDVWSALAIAVTYAGEPA